MGSHSQIATRVSARAVQGGLRRAFHAVRQAILGYHGASGGPIVTRILAAGVAVAAFMVGAHWSGATALDAVSARYAHLEPAPTFDFPVGPPDGEGYYDAQGFGENFHLGEDWNREGDAHADFGDPVHAIANGQVTYVGHAGRGWGLVVRVVHHVRRSGRSDFVESLYAHLHRADVKVGHLVERGEVLGTIGDADGAYIPHLHFEIRRVPDLPIGPGYSPDDSQWLDPSAFILAHRLP